MLLRQLYNLIYYYLLILLSLFILHCFHNILHYLLISLSYILLYLHYIPTTGHLMSLSDKNRKSVKLKYNKCILKLYIKCNNNHCSMYTKLCIPAISTPLLMLQLCKMYLINLYYRKYICI